MAATKVVNRQLKTDLDTKVDKVLESSLVADTEITKLAAITGTNTGDQAIPATGVDFDPAGTDNSDNNAVNTLYSGLVTNATHTGDVTGATALTIASDVVDLDNLAVDLKSRVVIAASAIDWSLGSEFTKTLAANLTITDSNLPTGTDTKCIAAHLTGEFTVAVPAYWVNKGGTYEGAKSNMYVIDCLNGTTASEVVNYIIVTDV